MSIKLKQKKKSGKKLIKIIAVVTSFVIGVLSSWLFGVRVSIFVSLCMSFVILIAVAYSNDI